MEADTIIALLQEISNGERGHADFVVTNSDGTEYRAILVSPNTGKGEYYYHAAWLNAGSSGGRCCVISDHLLTAEERITRYHRILSGPYATYKEGLKGKRADSN